MNNNMPEEQLKLLNSMLNFDGTLSNNSSYLLNTMKILQPCIEMNKDPIIFEENGKIYQIPVARNATFQNAIDDYENQTGTKGQNRYYCDGKQIDPNKTLEKNGLTKNSKITVMKYNNLIQDERFSLYFRKSGIQDFLIQGISNDPLMKFIGRYLQKLYDYGINLGNTYGYFYNGRKLLEEQSPSYNGLKNNDVIDVLDSKKIITVVFEFDGKKYNLVTNENERIGDLINKFMQKTNLAIGDKYWFVYQGKVIVDYYATIKQLGIRNSSEINVVPPGIQGA